MNKKLNTILFILGATAFNVLVAVLCFFILLLIYVRFIMIYLPENSQGWGFPVIFIAALAVSFVLYRFVIKLLLKKIDIEKYFDPIIKSRYKPLARPDNANSRLE
ncbi:MAG: leader peptide processing enzyme [Treponema sp.]|jgi:hypothetical protein|nr:leader peptide processing enzyme [Treponema sp.]